MHTEEDYKDNEMEESDYSDFYNTNEEEVIEKKDNGENKNKKVIIIICILAIILIALIIFLVIILKKEKPVDFNLSLKDINGDVWSKDNVTINIDVPDETNLKSLKYTINCEKKCDYVDVTDKKIVIANGGVSNVTVVSVNNDNVENKKNVTVKIDKAAPKVTLSPNDTNIKSTGKVTVCAICSDNESGCKEEKVCKDYSKTSKNQTLTVEDKVGNKSVSSKFNVTISSGSTTPTPTPVSTPSCSLSVNENGLVTAKYSSSDKYHGFSSSYSGTNETTKQLNLDNGKTTKVTYYVKNSDGKTASCSINVKASCACKYRADDFKCYKTLVKTVNDPNSAECKNAQRKTNINCSFYKDEGLTCTYTKN